MKKIVTILGARPQFIKASVVSAAISERGTFKEIVLHTGQHHDENMSDVFFNELGMNQPTYRLNIHGGGHGEMTGRMLIEIEKVLEKERPNVVMVYGDTNSTLAGALAAVKLHIPVAHVEAGLRSFNMSMPEEVNRILTDHVSQWLFIPTADAGAHLLREGIDANKIVSVGDVMLDVALYHGARVSARGRVLGNLFSEHGITAGNYCLATIHRAENTGNTTRLISIANAFSALSQSMPVVWPLHPRTRDVLTRLGLLNKLATNICLIDPVGYLDMVQLEKHASLIATDSGGVQKEAFFHSVPCVTLRDETEWVELVESGWNRLAPPTDAESVLSVLHASINAVGQQVAPYGDGNAAKRIVECLSLVMQ